MAPILLRLLPLARSFVLLILLALPAATAVTVSGRRLLVDGRPFTMKGINYTPTPPGRRLPAYNVAADAPMYKNDFKLLKAMGVNTLRIPGGDAATTAFLDEARANGFYVVMSYYVNTTWDITNATTQTAITAAFLGMVNDFKWHPAVLMWALGNEVTLNNPSAAGNPAAWYTLLNGVAGQAKAADPDHPVTTAVADVGDIGRSAINTLGSNPSNLDLWGINVYRGAGFTTAFSFLASTTTKPAWFSEFGADAYNGVAGAEDQAAQAAYLRSQWAEIAQNLSAEGTGALVGGAVFQWSDEWWKGANVGGCPGTGLGSGGPLGDLAQDATCDWSNGAYADPNINEEWWGIVAISSSVPLQKRVRRGYYALRDLWNPAASSAGEMFSRGPTNAPNPLLSGSSTRILFSLAQTPERIAVDVFDGAHRKVVSLPWTGGAGAYSADWDGMDTDRRPVSPGVYLVRVEVTANDQTEVKFRKVAVVR